MEEFFLFLAEELSSITDEIDDLSCCAHEVCVCLSIVGSNIPEASYRMYTDGLFADGRFLTNAVAYFSGAGFMNVVCDCESYNRHDCELFNLGSAPLFQAGLDDSLNKTDIYIATLNEINGLRTAVLS